MRRLLFLFILACATLTAAGCKADPVAQHAQQNDSPTSNQPKAPAMSNPPATSFSPTSDNRPLIVCFGDSLTAGYGTDPGQSYPDFLQADLDSQGYNYRVVNLGVSGDTTKDGLNRLSEVVALHPAVVVVEFGGNDGLRGLPIADSRASLDTIVHTLKSSSKILIAGISLPPNYGAAYIKDFDATYPLLAKKYDAPLLPFLFENVYGVPGMMQEDQTHATAAGNKVVAENVLPFLTPLLKK